MFVGHINLSTSMNGTGEHFVALVEALQEAAVDQTVIVRNATLAKRLALIAGVSVGPVVRSAVTAYCLMPRVDVVHVHEPSAAQAGLLLTLTRSVPYVLNYRADAPLTRNPLTLSVYRRAAAVVCKDDADASILRHFDPTIRTEILPELHYPGSADAFLHVYQNSQRMPMAGNNGIQ